MTPRPYTPFYCEENVWHLAGEMPGQVVVITSPDRRTPLWMQRAAPRDRPVLWDYHVVLAARDGVWDLDTRLPLPCALARYLDETFRRPASVRFRIIDAGAYYAEFSSDRRHMRRPAGDWTAPPPPWPAIQRGALTLDRMLTLEGDDVLDFDGARRLLLGN